MLTIERLNQIRRSIGVEDRVDNPATANACYRIALTQLLTEVDELRQQRCQPPATIPIHITPKETGKYLVGHRGHCEVIYYFHPNDEWHHTAKIGWQKDPAKFRAAWYMPVPTDG